MQLAEDKKNSSVTCMHEVSGAGVINDSKFPLLLILGR